MNDNQDSATELAIDIDQVKKTFDGHDYILNGIDLKIPRGCLMAIIGFSGTGKSVLLKHMLGLHHPSGRHVRVLGEDLAELSKDEITKLRCRFGVLFQGAALFDDMTVLENVCFPLFEHRRKLSISDREEIASEKLKLVGLEEKHFKKLPNQISGGMQKRVGLARALALDPEILFYDEPTTGLDPVLTEMVDDLILTSHKHREGVTSVVVSHDLDAAFRIADRVAMLDKGRVLLSGTLDDFLNTDIELVRRFVNKGMKRE